MDSTCARGGRKEGRNQADGIGFPSGGCEEASLAVKRIIEKGNHVTFGPSPEDNYILNKSTGDKMMLQENGKGSYLMQVKFVRGEKTTIIVDSGAEENLCPWDLGRELFGTRDANKWMSFRSATGAPIEHWGARDIKVVSLF